jgi:hypothetical protein
MGRARGVAQVGKIPVAFVFGIDKNPIKARAVARSVPRSRFSIALRFNKE